MDRGAAEPRSLQKWPFPVFVQILEQKSRKGVGLIALQLLHHLALPHVSVYIGIPWTVVILISQPLSKPPLRSFDEMECRPAPRSREIHPDAIFPGKESRNHVPGIHWQPSAASDPADIHGPAHSGADSACQHGTPKRAAQRHAGIRHFKVTAGAGQPVHAGALTHWDHREFPSPAPVLVADEPDNIFPSLLRPLFGRVIHSESRFLSN